MKLLRHAFAVLGKVATLLFVAAMIAFMLVISVWGVIAWLYDLQDH